MDTETIIIWVLITILFLLISISLYFSKTLRQEIERLKENLVKFYISLYTSRDGKTILTKNTL